MTHVELTVPTDLLSEILLPGVHCGWFSSSTTPATGAVQFHVDIDGELVPPLTVGAETRMHDDRSMAVRFRLVDGSTVTRQLGRGGEA